MNYLAKLAYKQASLQRLLYDNAVRKKSLDVRAIRLTVTENKYKDKEYKVYNHGILDIVISLPGNELQAFNGERTNNAEYNSGLGVYSIIPVTAYATTDANINKDDILIYKILLTPYDSIEKQETMLQIFQVSNKLSRATNTVLYNKLILAPYTFNMQEFPEIETIINDYQLEPIIL